MTKNKIKEIKKIKKRMHCTKSNRNTKKYQTYEDTAK